MQFFYAFGALKVASPFPLPGLMSVPDGAERPSNVIHLFIEKGALPESVEPVYRWSGRYGLSLWSHGKDWLLKSARNGSCLIGDNGTAIACYPESSTEAGMGELLVRRVLPRLAQLHGAVALHAAALSDGEAAYLLLGPSGAGKSTLSAALSRQLGWRVLSDDHAITYHDSLVPFASIAATGLCLRQDSMAAMDLEPTRYQRLTAYRDKFCCAVANDRILPPRPVHALLFLIHPNNTDCCPDRFDFKQIAHHETVIRLMHQLIRFNPTDMLAVAGLFSSLGRMAAGVPAYTVSYPRGYERLCDVVEQVSGLCREASGGYL